MVGQNHLGSPEMVWRALEPPDLSWDDHGSPHSTRHQDIYFAPDAGLDETRAVFLNGIGAPETWRNTGRFAIGETGFGTGLNFLATLQAWLATTPEDAQLDYVSCELHPMSGGDLARALAAFNALGDLRDQLRAQYPPPYPGFHQLKFAGGRVRLTLLFGDASQMLARCTGQIDAWYLDGFAPSKNPDMWQTALYREIARLSKQGAQLATFTAAGHVRRGLQSAGFDVIKTPGFAGKRERITARYQGAVEDSKPHTRHTAIIGAGIAGLSVAHALQQRGAAPVLIDTTGDLLKKSSGNPAALFSPKPALGIGPYDRLHMLSWLDATRFYDEIEASGHKVWLEPRGLQILSQTPKQRQHQAQLAQKFSWPEWLTGDGDKLSLPRAGSLDTAAVGRALAGQCTVIKATVGSITHHVDWQIWDSSGDLIATADNVVLANGTALYDLLDDMDNMIIPVRGQVELLAANMFDNTLPSTSFGSYLTAPVASKHGPVRLLGASNKRYLHGLPGDWADPSAADQQHSMAALAAQFPGIAKTTPVSSRVGVRATTHDRMPIVGPVPDMKALESLPTHKQKFRAHDLSTNQLHQGLFMLGGLGSRGYMTAPLLGEYTAALIEGTPPPLDRDIADAISPARYPLSTKP